ncbi:MAG TPA: acyl-CoA carboxylase epsilon subunit [Pseudonocardia sp.]
MSDRTDGTAVREEPTPEERRALFRVVRGEPDDAEAAALTVVLAALATEPVATAGPPRSRWTDRATHLRRTLPVGPDAWRTSLWPS